ncbi:hypothetical protein BDY21DRAFT_395748 [Lineolata rhizophorae]|uniref:Uncharacterized protein n=1 Tax=Lineolata rhizophorae TaxID=578093 RepID=A0A6A6NVP1_9PEZI|nr:hypothetical protein BDY21DRAFT_395748 [Lineolata rhizophorae]
MVQVKSSSLSSMRAFRLLCCFGRLLPGRLYKAHTTAHFLTSSSFPLRRISTLSSPAHLVIQHPQMTQLAMETPYPPWPASIGPRPPPPPPVPETPTARRNVRAQRSVPALRGQRAQVEQNPAFRSLATRLLANELKTPGNLITALKTDLFGTFVTLRALAKAAVTPKDAAVTADSPPKTSGPGPGPGPSRPVPPRPARPIRADPSLESLTYEEALPTLGASPPDPASPLGVDLRPHGDYRAYLSETENRELKERVRALEHSLSSAYTVINSLHLSDGHGPASLASPHTPIKTPKRSDVAEEDKKSVKSVKKESGSAGSKSERVKKFFTFGKKPQQQPHLGGTPASPPVRPTPYSTMDVETFIGEPRDGEGVEILLRQFVTQLRAKFKHYPDEFAAEQTKIAYARLCLDGSALARMQHHIRATGLEQMTMTQFFMRLVEAHAEDMADHAFEELMLQILRYD